MIPLYIDISEVIQEGILSKQEADELLSHLINKATDYVYEQWRDKAEQTLKSTKDNYVEGLVKGTEGRTGFVELNGEFNNWVEQGHEAWDMKSVNFEKHGKPSKSGGWYFTVNFRWGSTGATKEIKRFSNYLPANVQAKVKSNSGKPLKSSQVPAPFNQLKPTKVVMLNGVPTTTSQHKNYLMTGLIRTPKKYQVATQGKYSTFRRISDKSDPNSWLHPGLHAVNLAEKTQHECENTMYDYLEDVKDNFIENL